MLLSARFSILALTLGFAASVAQADTVATRIYRLEAPTSVDMPYQVLATHDGRVFFADPKDAALVAELQAVSGLRAPIRLVLDEDQVIATQPLSAVEAESFTDAFDSREAVAEADAALASDADFAVHSFRDGQPSAGNLPLSLVNARKLGYEPTILPGMADAQRLFDSVTMLRSKSQCYERAHVWSHQFEKSTGAKSMKVFLFFTNYFRNKYYSKVVFWKKAYKWWFHVAPFVYVGSNEEVVVDRQFLPGAVSMADWTYHFIGKVGHSSPNRNPSYEESRCFDSSDYMDYSQNRMMGEYCILRKVPMYYFQPKDVEALDGSKRTPVPTWRQNEINWAYGNT